VLAQQRPVLVEEEGRAVERAALPLHHPDDQAEVVPASRSSDGLGGRAGHLDGAVEVAAELLAALGGDRDGGLAELVRFVTPGGDKATPSVTVDREKVKADLEQAEQKAKEKVKGTGTAAQENPTGPGSAPAVEAKGD
jgi:hypothetical protein